MHTFPICKSLITSIVNFTKLNSFFLWLMTTKAKACLSLTVLIYLSKTETCPMVDILTFPAYTPLTIKLSFTHKCQLKCVCSYLISRCQTTCNGTFISEVMFAINFDQPYMLFLPTEIAAMRLYLLIVLFPFED